MKSRAKLANPSANKNLNIQSKAKIYVPISLSNAQQPATSESNISSGNDIALAELKRANLQLRQKQQIYIDKLIKLEEGLEKQHQQFMHLQDLYNQLFNSYKQKEQEIAELEQKYRETNRKKQSINHQPQQSQYLIENNGHLKKQIAEQKQINQKLQLKISQYGNKINDFEKTIQKLCSEVSYYKNKDKMNDSRASLSSKVFEELGQWQRQADTQKQEKIKLQYENRFLKSRNEDLQSRLAELQEIVILKQSQVLRLRQNNIVLSRQNSENRLFRSSSRSPRKYQQKQNSDRKTDLPTTKTSRIIDELHSQNTILKKELSNLKQSLSSSYNVTVKSPSKNGHYIRQQQFFSFSRDDYSNHSSNQEHQRTTTKQHTVKIENDYEVQKIVIKQKEFIQHSSRNEVDGDEVENQSLQQLPAELEIDNIIMNSKRKQNTDL